jgi:hypothetical protein
LSASALLTDKLGRDSINAEQVRISLIVALVKVLEAYMQMYSSTAAFVETFQPCLNVLAAMKSVEDWNEDVKVCFGYGCMMSITSCFKFSNEYVTFSDKP